VTARREHELLLCCARTNLEPEKVERLKVLSATTIDFDYLFLLARRHSVVPLLFKQLNQYARDLVPSDFLAKLKKHYRENIARNTVLTSELCALLELLQRAGIEAVPYKGPLLALFAYGDLTLRRYVDLDIMVRKEDVLKARDVLVQYGYKPAKDLNTKQLELLLRNQHNLQFKRDNDRIIVELHWEVASHLFASSVQADDIWKSLVSMPLGRLEVKTFSADDLLFSLCVHGSRHLWERLGWICDVAELIARHNISWDSLLTRAATNDSERMFLLGLCLAERLVDAPVPNQVQKIYASDGTIESLSNSVIENLFNGTEHVPATASEVLKYNFEVRKSWTARARYFAYAFRPTDADLAARSLPPGLTFAYHLLRPFRLLFKNGN
jgi:hypothetical protein